MSNGTTTQIRDTYAALDDLQTPLTVEEIMHLAGPVRPIPFEDPQHTERPWRKPALVAALAAVAVLVVFGGLSLLLARSSSDLPAATTPTTVTSVTSPATTTSLPAEDSGPAVGVNTYQELPNESSIGWEWYETGLESETSVERGDRVYRLGNGTYVAYNQGWDGTLKQEDGTETFVVDLPGQSGTAQKRVDDPVERFRISTNGTSWDEVPLDRFEGFATGALMESPGGLPYLYVGVRPLDAGFNDAAAWSTWATDDGETWFEVLIDGESAAPWFSEYVQIGERAVAYPSADVLLASSDGGRSFDTVDPSAFGLAMGDLRRAEVFLYEGAFRLLAWTEEFPGAQRDMWMENPVLWESADGEDWTLVGVASGLEPQPDGRGLIAGWYTEIESLPDGDLVLSGAEPRRATFSNDWAAYVLESDDGGLTWAPIENFPTTADPDFNSLIRAGFSGTTLDGWVVLSTGDVTLATDGKTWIRVDIPSGDLDSVDSFGNRLTPNGHRGVVVSGWDMAWILLPSR